MPNWLIWCGLLSPLPLIGLAGYLLYASRPKRMARTLNGALAVLGVSYSLILLELVAPTSLGNHYGDLRAYTVLVCWALAVAVMLLGACSWSKAGAVLALAAANVALGWMYLAVIGTAV